MCSIFVRMVSDVRSRSLIFTLESSVSCLRLWISEYSSAREGDGERKRISPTLCLRLPLCLLKLELELCKNGLESLLGVKVVRIGEADESLELDRMDVDDVPAPL